MSRFRRINSVVNSAVKRQTEGRRDPIEPLSVYDYQEPHKDRHGIRQDNDPCTNQITISGGARNMPRQRRQHQEC